MPDPILTPLPYAAHGGPNGSAPPRFDFSVNSNPFGPPQALLEHLQKVDLARYPDPGYREARVGGAAELIYRLSACYLRPGRGVLIAAPSFGEYARAAQLHGAAVHLCPVYAKGREPDMGALVRAVRDLHPTLVWLGQPNNPTGHRWHADALAEVAAACRQRDALLVVDAAYLELSRTALTPPEGAVTLLPLTKSFGIAGLRAGYALAPPGVADLLRRAAPPWSVSSPAAAAVTWCRSNAGADFLADTVPPLLELRASLQARVVALGFEVWGAHSSFFLIEVGDAVRAAERAEGAGLRLRDASSFGLPSCVRVAAGREQDNEALLGWLAAC
jgi:histidinol-phosphate aminotransferase